MTTFSILATLVNWIVALRFTNAIRLKRQPHLQPSNLTITPDLICRIRNGTVTLPKFFVPAPEWSEEFGNDDWKHQQDRWFGNATEDGPPTWATLTNLNGTIPIFTLDKTVHNHMRDMVLNWGTSHGKLARSNFRTFELQTVMNGGLSVHAVQQAFAFLRAVKPLIVVWLLPFTTGDYERVMLDGILKQVIDKTSTHTRHGVFVWPPEFCDQGAVTADLLHKTYENADFVFQFGYHDERLSALNASKFLPWPLGPAWWKGWETPLSALPTSNRQHLAVFRGCNATHCDLSKVKQLMAGHAEVLIEDSGDWHMYDDEVSKNRYKELLLDSRYALQLPGNNPNCYRIAEAIECGSIPVVVVQQSNFGCYDNWLAVYGLPNGTEYSWIPKAPFAVLDTWEYLPYKLMELTANASDELGVELSAWHMNWQQAFRDKFHEKLQDSFNMQMELRK